MPWNQEELDAFVAEVKSDDNTMPKPPEKEWPVMVKISRTYCIPVTAVTQEEAVQVVKENESDYFRDLDDEIFCNDQVRAPEEWEMVLYESAIHERVGTIDTD